MDHPKLNQNMNMMRKILMKKKIEDEQLPYDESNKEFSSEGDELHAEKGEGIFIYLKSVGSSCINHFKKVWISLKPPSDKIGIIDCSYAEIYIGKKWNSCLYWLAQKRYLDDENAPTSALELDCFQRKLETSDDILEFHKNGKHEIFIFVPQRILHFVH